MLKLARKAKILQRAFGAVMLLAYAAVELRISAEFDACWEEAIGV